MKTKKLLMPLLVAVALLFPAIAKAGYGKIYLIGADGRWYPPFLDNSEYFKDYELPEVAPDVYEGTFYFQSSYFRFFTEFGEYVENSNLIWRENFIFPAVDGLRLELSDNGAVYTSHTLHDVKRLPNHIEPGTWWLAPGEYRIVVNLNDKTLKAYPKNAVVMAINGEKVTDENVGSLPSFCNMRYYQPEGKFEFSLLDLYTNKWINPETDGEGVYDNTPLNYAASDVQSGHFTVNSWPGGIFSGKVSRPYNEYYLNYDTDKYVHNSKPCTANALGLVGDINSWDSYEPLPCEKLDAQGALWSVTIPAGTTEFKLIDGTGWNIDFGVSHVEKLDDGTVRCFMVSDFKGGNFTFTESLSQSVTATVNLQEMFAVFPAGTPMQADRSSDFQPGDCIYVLNENVNYLPWKGASQGVFDSFDALYPDGNGNYVGTTLCSGHGFAFISGYGNSQSDAKLIGAPSANFKLNVSDANAYARAVNTSLDKVNYFSLPENINSYGGEVEVTITPGTEPKVRFVFDGLDRSTPKYIYLIGTPTGWSNSSDAFPLSFTTAGVYYGEFEIPEGELSFRLFTKLGAWSSDASIGSDPEDFYEAPIYIDDNSELTYSASVPGMGNWNVQNWTGGMLYISYNPENSIVTMSKHPIEGVGLPVDQVQYEPYPSAVYSLVYNSTLHEVEGITYSEIRDNVYHSLLYGGGTANLYTRWLPITPAEPEWKGSYSLSARNSTFKYDKSIGVGSVEFENRNYINSEEPESFATPEEDCSFNLYVDVDNNITYYERYQGNLYLGGDMLGETTVGFTDITRLKAISVPFNGGVKNIPAGDTKLIISSNIGEINYVEPRYNDKEYELKFVDGKAYISQNTLGYESILNRNLTVKDWKGGEVYVTRGLLYDFSQRQTPVLGFFDGKDVEEYTMSQSQESPMVYTVEVPYSRELGGNICSAGISVKVCDDVLYFGGYSEMPYTGTPENRTVTAENDTKRMIQNGYSYTLPTLIGEGILKATVDFRDMTVTFDLSQAEAGSVYEVVSDNNPDIDGATAYPSTLQDEAVTAEIEVNVNSANDAFEFNLTDDKGSVISPATGEEEIVFGSDGSWTGSYTTTSAARSGMNARRLAQSPSSGKWHFVLPEGASGKVNLLIDEKNKTITAFCPEVNRDYFIVNSVSGTYDVMPVIENLKSLPRLVKALNGNYYGKFTIPQSDTESYNMVAFTKGFVPGDYLPVGIGVLDSYYVADFSTASVLEIPAVGESVFGYSTASWLRYFGAADEIGVTYNPVANLLTLDAINAGVDNVSLDTALSVRGTTGALEIICSAATDVEVYNLQGIAVKSLSLVEGYNRVEMPAGLYIVAGSKAIVR